MAKVLALPDQLLAKSKRQGREITLEAHLRDTENAAQRIFRLERRWGRNWCVFFGLHGELQNKFLLNLRIAGLFHDIGKANEDFLTAVSELGFKEQTLRHEHLSALILHFPEVRGWLKSNPDLDVEVITASVLSHHLKASDKDDGCKWGQPRTEKKAVQLFLDHPEVTRILMRIADIAALEGVPVLTSKPWTAEDGSPWHQAWKEGSRTANQLKRDLRKASQWERRALLLAVKAGLIVADAAASGLVREGHEIEDWIEEVITSPPIGQDEISDAILNPRIKQIEARIQKPFEFHRFQEGVAQQGPRTLLLAACGSGKTLGAWKWAEAQIRQKSVGKVIFLYPTRGTATEGFRDYVGWAPEASAALITGTSRYELEAMAENPAESIRDKDFHPEERLFALGYWSRRFFSATVDQFLGFLEHNYSSLCLLPVLADSVVIIDEIHSFDRKMFNGLVNFLRTFDIPVLCMTATLPPTRQQELESIGMQVYPTAADQANLTDLAAEEEHPRYRLHPVEGFDEAFRQAVEAYAQNLRVLWVVNTVDRCQAIAERLEKELSTEVLTYHSRYRLKDRQDIHSQTVKAFAFYEGNDIPRAIAVTTQVCEMSLDLDADVLITEYAPIPSLVQRFGRANRHRIRERKFGDQSFRASLLVYEPPKYLPYKKEEIQLTRSFIQILGEADISQRRLAQLLKDLSPDEAEADNYTSFMSGGYYARTGSFRDTDEFAVPCILDSDLDKVGTLINDKKPYDGLIVNVPKRSVVTGSEKPNWLPRYLDVAPTTQYCPHRGFVSTNLEEVDLG